MGLRESREDKGRRLLAEYRAATHHYSWAVAKLSRAHLRSGGDADKLAKLVAVVDEARSRFESAADALRKFKAENNLPAPNKEG
jgi:hypothetical protein